ncbi:MAG: ATP-binding protein, partial [Terriglobia bacterium]
MIFELARRQQDALQIRGSASLPSLIVNAGENAAVIMTTNLPFSEWTQVIPNARLCKALLD